MVMDPDKNQSSSGGTGAATAVQATQLRVAVKTDNQERIVLGTWNTPPPGYRFAKDHEIRDLLELLPAPALRTKIFEACTGVEQY
jgi:hypothetical protein